MSWYAPIESSSTSECEAAFEDEGFAAAKKWYKNDNFTSTNELSVMQEERQFEKIQDNVTLTRVPVLTLVHVLCDVPLVH